LTPVKIRREMGRMCKSKRSSVISAAGVVLDIGYVAHVSKLEYIKGDCG